MDNNITAPISAIVPGEPLMPAAARSPYGNCFFCGQPLILSYYVIPAVRDGGSAIYTVRVHVACYQARYGAPGGRA